MSVRNPQSISCCMANGDCELAESVDMRAGLRRRLGVSVITVAFSSSTFTFISSVACKRKTFSASFLKTLNIIKVFNRNSKMSMKGGKTSNLLVNLCKIYQGYPTNRELDTAVPLLSTG